jgi:uncharacterized membrane-anchored protein
VPAYVTVAGFQRNGVGKLLAAHLQRFGDAQQQAQTAGTLSCSHLRLGTPNKRSTEPQPQSVQYGMAGRHWPGVLAARCSEGKNLSDLRSRCFTEMLNRVPEVTLAFWVIKIMSTTVGETGADYLAVHVGLGTAATDGIMVTLLIVSLLLQLWARRYTPWRYWLTVVLVSVVGTQITDFLTDSLDVSLYVSTIVFAITLAVTFTIWYAIERTLSIHTIVTTRRELFYWTAILFTFALGTAAGDLATEALQLGFQLGVIIFGVLIAVVALTYFRGANPILTFWIAYVLTRPLGASLGDLLSQAQTYGGLGLGTVVTSGVFLTIIAVLVSFLSFWPRIPMPVTLPMRDGESPFDPG